MEDKIYELITGWANVSTWYTGHPLDQKRFYQAMGRVVSEIDSPIDIECFERALRRHVETNPDVLGQPSHWDELISNYVIKAETIFDYEYER